tara:strand:- start:721 stop:915 length:195 start_codon:yes stop_codon:yes gene_type:complete
MILKEHTENISSYIETMNNIKMAITIAKNENDIDIIIKILNQFQIATNSLVDLLNITKKERITA